MLLGQAGCQHAPVEGQTICLTCHNCLVSNAIAFPRKVKAFCAGGSDCRQPVANQTLLYAEQNIAQRPGPYFDQNFYNSCSIITWNKFHLCVTSSLAVNTCTNIYKHLVNFLPF